jgi:hypothetical protein
MFDPQLTDAFLQIVWRLLPVSANGLPTVRQPYAAAPHAIEASAR